MLMCNRLFSSKGGKCSGDRPPEVDASVTSGADISATDLTFVMTKFDAVLSETVALDSIFSGPSN